MYPFVRTTGPLRVRGLWGRFMKKLLLASIAIAALCGAPAFSADMPTKAQVKAETEPPLDFTVAFGGSWNSGSSVHSSSGFYTGDIKSYWGYYVSAGASVPIGKVGAYNVRVGPSIEWMQGGFHFSGLAGGVPETLSGHQDQWNYLATMNFSTKIGPKMELYFGPDIGIADVSTHGTPCFGCPRYRDPWAFEGGAHVWLGYEVSPDLDVGYALIWRYTASTNNKTDSPVENFRNGASNAIMGGLYFKYSPPASDIRLKRDIHLLATLDNGLKIYSFKYLWSDTAYVGVMAQDLLANSAWRDAVVTMPNGFYAVNYEELGLRMVTLDQWREQGLAAVTGGVRQSAVRSPIAVQTSL
jgi:hypothetical protein